MRRAPPYPGPRAVTFKNPRVGALTGPDGRMRFNRSQATRLVKKALGAEGRIWIRGSGPDRVWSVGLERGAQKLVLVSDPTFRECLDGLVEVGSSRGE